MAFYAFHRGYNGEAFYQADESTNLAIIDTVDMSLEYYTLGELLKFNIELCNIDSSLTLHYRNNFPAELSSEYWKVNIVDYDNQKREVSFIATYQCWSWHKEFVAVGTNVNPVYFENNAVCFPVKEIEVSCAFVVLSKFVLRLLITDEKNGVFRAPVYVFMDLTGQEKLVIAYKEDSKLTPESDTINHCEVDNFDCFTFSECYTDILYKQKYFRIRAADDYAIDLMTGELKEGICDANCANMVRNTSYATFCSGFEVRPHIYQSKGVWHYHIGFAHLKMFGKSDTIDIIIGKVRYKFRRDIILSSDGFGNRLTLNGMDVALYKGDLYLLHSYIRNRILVISFNSDKLHLFFDADGKFIGAVGYSPQSNVICEFNDRSRLSRCIVGGVLVRE